jgi:hypothetical protein
VVVAIDDAIEQKLDGLHAHESQFYEWLPYNGRYLNEVPADPAARREWLRQRRFGDFLERDAQRYRNLLIKYYGPERAAQVRYAEAFEGCEYGARLTPENIHRLFPFFS